MSEAPRSFVCPRCSAQVSATDESYFCGVCKGEFPVVCGIPDFRVFADPYIGIEEDREKAQYLFEKAQTLSFRELVEHYVRIAPEVPPSMAQGYARWIVSDAPAERAITMLENLRARGILRLKSGAVLEVGAGLGPFVAPLAESYARVVQSDIALRWLVLARKGASELGIRAEWVCCCAEALPFAANTFDVVVGASVLEHVRDAETFLSQCVRILNKDGVCVFWTPNRWSMRPDPHMGVFGLGLSPVTAKSEVAAPVRGLPFDKARTRGYAEWTRTLLEAGFRRVEFALPDPPPGMTGVRAAVAALHRFVKAQRLSRAVLLLMGPGFEIVAFKGPNRR
jgi:ubiquinone/menaquinone biosynthesis C-methylase UbiE